MYRTIQNVQAKSVHTLNQPTGIIPKGTPVDAEQPHDRTALAALKREDDLLELYHNINSVCAQKVRIALEEKGRRPKITS